MKKIDINANRLFYWLRKELYYFYNDFGLWLVTLAALLVLVLSVAHASHSYGIMSFFANITYPLAGMIVTSSIFIRAKRSPDNLFYLTTPASPLEKWLVAWFISFVLLPLIILVLLFASSVLGGVAHLFMHETLEEGQEGYAYYLLSRRDGWRWAKTVWSWFENHQAQTYFIYYNLTSIASTNAIYMFGSIAFGRKALVKTWVAIMIISTCFFALAQILFFLLFFGMFDSTFYYINTLFEDFQEVDLYTLLNWGLVPAVMVPLVLWFLSYLKLKEVES